MALLHKLARDFSRRKFLKNLGLAPVLFRHSPLSAFSSLFGPVHDAQRGPDEILPLAEARYTPHYPSKSPLQGILRLAAPGTDDYVEERYATEIETVLRDWALAFRVGDFSKVNASLDPGVQASSFKPAKETALRSGGAVKSFRNEYAEAPSLEGQERFLSGLREWLGQDTQLERFDFEVIAIEEPSTEIIATEPSVWRLTIRYEIVASKKVEHREQRSGTWLTEWKLDQSSGQSRSWKMHRLRMGTEMRSAVNGPVFVDASEQTLGHITSYQTQMLHGSDYWRTTLDGACGIDVYGNNGIAAGDFDNDGFDDLYISQPNGLPNRLYHNRGDGTFDDVTEAAGVGVLDNTSCALFADLRNCGLQDLLVVCGSGPLLFINQGNGTFKIKPDAFNFVRTPQGTFTHAAISDYDRDGRLDLYFCLYSYYLGLDQYHYPVPYFDARNGPPNFLMHNQGDGTFVDRTEAAGLNVENDRYSFACAWNESSSSHMPDLYVVNDFGRNNLYRNNGDGTFSAASVESHVEDVGAGMSACWLDFNNDGKSDIYVANMWSAAGQRVSQQSRFHKEAAASTRELYRRHALGNALYQNDASGVFRNVSERAAVDLGRWAWGSDSWDFDHDGYSDIYVTNGYISATGTKAEQEKRTDLSSFFWRQLVAKSPDDSTPSLAYEHGWNAINELIRSDNSWNGFERNVMFANNRDGTFSEIAGVAGIDLIEDGRSFALADIDHDGRLEVVVKNRNSPQLRTFHNVMKEIGDSISFRLRGTKSNRDGIGTEITLQAGDLIQTKYLQAGTGFLAQHSKEVFFGVGATTATINATVRWPGGLIQKFEGLPRNSRIQLEEGSAASQARPFAATTLRDAAKSSQAAMPVERGTESVETWLLDPLKAPVFTLPDLAGTMRQLQSFQGRPTLLCFWSASSPLSQRQLKSLNQQHSALEAVPLNVVALNLDLPEQVKEARVFTEREKLSLPVLFATEEVAGIYSIVYRYLFDRRRDLPIPASFLLDREGSIVKLYQGAFPVERLLEDARAIPLTPEARVKKALPFAGTLHRGEFQRNDFTYGVAMFQHGYLDQAEESFKQVVVAKPNDAEGYYNLGTLNLRKNNFEQARIYLEQTLKLRPDYPEAWNNLGMMAAQQGHADEAIENFKQSLKLRPGHATALINLGNVYRRQGKFAEAKESLTSALDLQPDDPEANYSLGMFYAQQNELQTAEKYLQRAADLRPDYAEALNNLGVISVRKQDYAKAIEQFKECISMVSGFDQSYLNLARVYVIQHDKPKAEAVLQELLRLRPDSPAGKQGLQVLETAP